MRVGMKSGLMLISAISLCLSCTSSSEKKREVVATLRDVKGEVLVQRKNEKKWIKAFDGMKILMGDKVKTGSDGRALADSTECTGTNGTSEKSCVTMMISPNMVVDFNVYMKLLLRNMPQPAPPEMER